MTIHHRLNLSADLAQPILRALRLPFPQNPPEDGQIVIPDISEDDPVWPTVALLLDEYHRAWTAHPENAFFVENFGSVADPLADMARAKFSDRDRKAAAYLSLDASLIGFPQPQDILRFYEPTYKTACSKCRIGSEQIFPLCLSGEPKWARSRGMFMLNWVPDEFLVRPEMYVEVFRPFGIASRPVLDYESQEVLKTVVQLDIPLRADVDVAKATYDICGSCGGRSYDRDARNYTPMPLSAPGPLFKSNQWFNPFHSIVYMTQHLFRSIGQSGFRGAYSIPCAAAEGSREAPEKVSG
jgi:hypothetical protein